MHVAALRCQRMPGCGIISTDSLAGLPEGPDRTPLLLRAILTKRLTVRGFLIFDHADEYRDLHARLAGWLAEGRLRYREDMVEGLENAPAVFPRLFEGTNFGKLVVRP